MISKILGLFTGGTIDAVGRNVARFTGDKVQQESNSHSEMMSMLDQVSEEHKQYQGRKSWFDSIVLGIKTLIRPLATIWVFALITWPMLGPEYVKTFSAAMTALELVPNWLAGGFVAVMAFWFGGRYLDKRLSFKSNITSEQVNNVIKMQNEILELKGKTEKVKVDNIQENKTVYKPKKLLSDADFEEAMKSEKPLSDDAIHTWNSKNNSSYNN